MELSSPVVGNALAAGLASGFVVTMWLFKGAASRRRDDSQTIVNRFKSTALVSIAAILVVMFFQPNSHRVAQQQDIPIPRRLGLYSPFYLLDTLFVLGLNSCLFLGPLIDFYFQGKLQAIVLASAFLRDLRRCGQRHKTNEDLQAIRQYFFGPCTEEVVYRMAVCYCLYFSGVSRTGTYLLSALYFSLAHGHHLYEHVRQEDIPWARAWPPVAAQLLMTFVFGLYGCYIYMTTGSLLNAMVLHIYCNYLGPPNLSFLEEADCVFIGVAYVVGLALFWVALGMMDIGTWTGSIFYLTSGA